MIVFMHLLNYIHVYLERKFQRLKKGNQERKGPLYLPWGRVGAPSSDVKSRSPASQSRNLPNTSCVYFKIKQSLINIYSQRRQERGREVLKSHQLFEGLPFICGNFPGGMFAAPFPRFLGLCCKRNLQTIFSTLAVGAKKVIRSSENSKTNGGCPTSSPDDSAIQSFFFF